jgi:hypothetical protein
MKNGEYANRLIVVPANDPTPRYPCSIDDETAACFQDYAGIRLHGHVGFYGQRRS